MFNIEIWKPIIYKGKELGYDVSTEGRVRNSKSRKILSPVIKENGYYIVNIGIKKNKRKNMYIHRLVAMAFIYNPDPETYTEVNHINGKKYDNCEENLEWVTPSENRKHAFRIGLLLPMKGEKSPNTDYTDDEIREVCKMIQKGKTNKEIHKKIGIKKSVINSVRNRRRWTHISDEFDFGDCISEYNSKFTIDDIEECCKMLENGCSSKEITKAIGINKNIISRIRHNKAWVSISKKYNIKPIHKKSNFKKYWNIIEEMLLKGYSRKEIREMYPIKDITKNSIFN